MHRLPFVSAQIVMGPVILQATRIYRRRSVMQCGDWPLVEVSLTVCCSIK